MKTLRLISLFLVLAIAISAWTPASALAKQAEPRFSHSVIAKARPKAPETTRLTFINKTGGILMITLTGLKRKTSEIFKISEV